MTKERDLDGVTPDPGTTASPDSPKEVSTLLVPDEREATIQWLSAAFASDHITAEEFERRVTEVYRVTTRDALAVVTADLPSGPPSPAPGPGETMPGEISTLLSSVERGGTVRVPSELKLRSVLGNIELDLRDAQFGDGVTEITVQSILGNVEVVLPEDVEVQCHVATMLGNFAHRASRSDAKSRQRSGSFVRITGQAILGNVEVSDAPRTELASSSEDPLALLPRSPAE